MNFDQRTSSKNLFAFDYDHDKWIPVPVSFEGTKWGSVERWATQYATQHVHRAFGDDLSKKIVRKEVTPRAQNLMMLQQGLAGVVPAHHMFAHCPDAVTGPQPVGIGRWATQGTREQALQYYAYWGVHRATEQPFAEWFDTEHLGRGLKATWPALDDDGDPMWQVNFGFRHEELEVDLHIFSSCPNKERFEQFLPDLDTLVQGIRCIPAPDHTA